MWDARAPGVGLRLLGDGLGPALRQRGAERSDCSRHRLQKGKLRRRVAEGRPESARESRDDGLRDCVGSVCAQNP